MQGALSYSSLVCEAPTHLRAGRCVWPAAACTPRSPSTAASRCSSAADGPSSAGLSGLLPAPLLLLLAAVLYDAWSMPLPAAAAAAVRASAAGRTVGLSSPWSSKLLSPKLRSWPNDSDISHAPAMPPALLQPSAQSAAAWLLLLTAAGAATGALTAARGGSGGCTPGGRRDDREHEPAAGACCAAAAAAAAAAALTGLADVMRGVSTG